MEKRTVGIVATVITVLLCGCPGLISLCGGLFFALTSVMPGAKISNFDGSSDVTTAVATGLAGCCFGLIFVAIPIAVGFFTLRKKAEEGVPPIIEADSSSQPPLAPM